MRMEETWTILRVIQWTTDYFARKGIDQPRAGAEVLLAHALGVERLQLYLHHDKPLGPEELARYREAVRRRASREPVQYITGKQEFWSLEFEVNSAVLIPRPETELLVERAIELIGDYPAVVLDLGTGSGAVAVAIAHEKPAVRIVAADRSLEALAVARRNALRHGVSDLIALAAMDLLSSFSRDLAPFDLIVSNPPYIGEEELQSLAPEVKCHEPMGALRGGGLDGLDIIRRILAEAPGVLKPSGCLLVEIGHKQAEILDREIRANHDYAEHRFFEDFSGILRILQARKKERVRNG